MAEIQHRDIPISQNHSPFRWIVPDQAGRDSIVNFEGNGNKLLLQHDTRQIFYLREQVIVVGQPPQYSWVEVGTSIEDSANWDEAYSWGDHALVGYAMSGDNTDITSLSNLSHISFDELAGHVVGGGEVAWNAEDGTLDIGLNGTADSVLQVGLETLYRVDNSTGSAIPDGTLVMYSGTVGNSGRLRVTPWDGSTQSQYIMGLATHDIPNGEEGYVVAFGKARGINTSGSLYGETWVNGDIIYAAPNGGMTNVQPTAPNSKTMIGVVISTHSTNGEIFVRPSYSSSINNDENVELSNIATGQFLKYVTDRFENVFLTESDITDLDKYTQSQVDTLLTTKEDTTNKGVADGYASLDSTGKVPSAQLPSFVDDVEEYPTENDFPVTGEQGKLYVALDTNKVYRWSGTTYIYITSGAVDSVNSKTGVVSLTTTDIPEDANLYFTEQRVRDSVSASGDLTYNPSTGDFSVTTYKSTDFDSDLSTKSTTDLSEGINLYHTQQRVRDSLSASGDISYNSTTGEFSVTTYKSTDFDSDFSGKSTTDLSEGINLYFTDQRAKDAVSTELSGKVDKGSTVVSSNTTATVNTNYHFSSAATLTLPTGNKGDLINVTKDSGITPIISGSITYQGTSDTTLEYDFDIGISLVYDGVTWILLYT